MYSKNYDDILDEKFKKEPICANCKYLRVTYYFNRNDYACAYDKRNIHRFGSAGNRKQLSNMLEERGYDCDRVTKVLNFIVERGIGK